MCHGSWLHCLTSNPHLLLPKEGLGNLEEIDQTSCFYNKSHLKHVSGDPLVKWVLTRPGSPGPPALPTPFYLSHPGVHMTWPPPAQGGRECFWIARADLDPYWLWDLVPGLLWLPEQTVHWTSWGGSATLWSCAVWWPSSLS